MCGKTKGFQQFPALKNKISPKSTFKCKSPAALHTQKQQQSHKHPLKPCRKSSANHRCVYVYVYVYVHTHIYILYSSYFLESTEERGKKFPGFEKWVSKSCVQTIRAGKAARYLQHMTTAHLKLAVVPVVTDSCDWEGICLDSLPLNWL